MASHARIEAESFRPSGREYDLVRGAAALKVLALLDSRRIPYCVLHGYDVFPEVSGSDVDIVVSRDVSATELAQLFEDNRTELGARVVRQDGYHFLLYGETEEHRPFILDLDISLDCEVGGAYLFSGDDILRSCRRHDGIWVPAAHIEFSWYLARRVIKKEILEAHERRLTFLFRQDPAGCASAVRGFFSDGNAGLIEEAARSGDWSDVRGNLSALRSELLRTVYLRRPGRTVLGKLARAGRRALTLIAPRRGFVLVLLGPDGAGKSSVSSAIREQMAGTFSSSVVLRFPPGLISNFKGRTQSTEVNPHGDAPRSSTASVVRALAYWWVFYSVLYRVKFWISMSRFVLAVHDRHPVDALVDPLRYGYGGPKWPLWLIWWSMPRPDLVVVLDGPADLIHARKKELTLSETARQREAYRALVRPLPFGRLVDCSRPLGHVVADVRNEIISSMIGRYRA